MGCELGMEAEWIHDAQIPWHLLDDPSKAGVQMLLRDLNRLYLREPALHALDTEPGGFQWLVADDAENSVFAFVRYGGGGAPVAVLVNLTPQVHHSYRVGLPHAGAWREILNTDADAYGGSNVGNGGAVEAYGHGCHGLPFSASVVLPPLGAVLLQHEGSPG